jgi:hypothetical protein
MKWVYVAVMAVALSLIPAVASAEDGEKDNDVLIRINSNVHIPAGERVGTLVVINGDAIIDGEVERGVFVARGNATVNGSIKEQLVVVSGDIDLRSGSQVKDVVSVRGDLIRDSGAVVTGEVTERENIGFGFLGLASILFSIYLWLTMTIALVVAGLVFAAVGGRQLNAAARIMTGEAVNTIVGVVFVWVAIPIIAFIAVITLVGLPLGVGLMLFLLPALGFLGYIVAANRLGSALVARFGNATADHPFGATTLGILLLQLVLLVPVVGAIVAAVAGIWGAGALAYLAYRSGGGHSMDSTAGSVAPQGGPQAQGV